MDCHRRGQIHLTPPSSRTDPPLLVTVEAGSAAPSSCGESGDGVGRSKLKDGQPKRPPVVAVLLHGASRRRTLAWGRLPDMLVVQTGGCNFHRWLSTFFKCDKAAIDARDGKGATEARHREEEEESAALLAYSQRWPGRQRRRRRECIRTNSLSYSVPSKDRIF
uniref:Uncharacterized protein n=1 Tax=Oryza sativa subsp. japonica TaxID=39947 RepID=Q6ZHP5_ORYSJ|nr:hypothetical protein [Oryza sativa Japonica Group]